MPNMVRLIGINFRTYILMLWYMYIYRIEFLHKLNTKITMQIICSSLIQTFEL